MVLDTSPYKRGSRRENLFVANIPSQNASLRSACAGRSAFRRKPRPCARGALSPDRRRCPATGPGRDGGTGRERRGQPEGLRSRGLGLSTRNSPRRQRVWRRRRILAASSGRKRDPTGEGSTYLVQLSPDGRVLVHAKDMSLSGRQLNPLVYAEILTSLGIDLATLATAASADPGRFGPGDRVGLRLLGAGAGRRIRRDHPDTWVTARHSWCLRIRRRICVGELRDGPPSCLPDSIWTSPT